MKIVYDPPKRLANLLKHRLDFADLEDGAFFETALVRPAKLGRFQAIGRFDDGTIVVVCSARQGRAVRRRHAAGEQDGKEPV